MIEVRTTQVPCVLFDCPYFEGWDVAPFHSYIKEMVLW